MKKADILDEFCKELIIRIKKSGLKELSYNYVRPKDLSPFEKWLKEQMDAMGIEKADLDFINGKINLRNINYLVEGSSSEGSSSDDSI